MKKEIQKKEVIKVTDDKQNLKVTCSVCAEEYTESGYSALCDFLMGQYAMPKKCPNCVKN